MNTLEKVARAIAEKANRQSWDITQDVYVHDCDPPIGRLLAVELARAALEALLDNSADACRDAGIMEIWQFRKVIQAALEGK